MDYRHPDWRTHPFDADAVSADWHSTVIRPLGVDDPRLGALVDDLVVSNVNGGAQLARFAIEAAPSVKWLLSRNRWGEHDLFRRFFGRAEVVNAFPEFGKVQAEIADFKMENGFNALGALAGFVSGGGAYRRHAGSDESALNLVTDFMRGVCDMRLSETFVWVNWKAWTNWFYDVAWDGTFFWFDTRTGIATVLLITDTD